MKTRETGQSKNTVREKRLIMVECPENLKKFDVLEIIEHRMHTSWRWNPALIELHRSPKSKLTLQELIDEGDGRDCFNANEAVVLLDNVELIPKEWENCYLVVSDSKFKDCSGRECVIVLYNLGTKWDWDYELLEKVISSDYRLVIKKNPTKDGKR